jgi:hypothetical protein
MDRGSSGSMMGPYTLGNTKMRTRLKGESLSCNQITPIRNKMLNTEEGEKLEKAMKLKKILYQLN